MLSSAPRQIEATQAPTPRRPARTQEVCVVDPQAGDYQNWARLAESGSVRLRIVGSAGEALRLARTSAIDLWVVNLELPGLSGAELCGMLRARGRMPIYLVANEYSPTAERAAWQAGATLFGCKGAHLQWLDYWLHEQASKVLARSAPTV